MNKLIATARLTKDIEQIRYTEGNMAIGNMHLAIDLGAKRNGEKETLFIYAKMFDKIAENCSKYLTKGSLISCDITIKNNNYLDKNGNKKYEYEFILNDVRFLHTNKQNVSQQFENNVQKNESENEDPFKNFGSEVTDNELPF